MARDDSWLDDKRRRYRALRDAGASATDASRAITTEASYLRALRRLRGEPEPERLCRRCGANPPHSPDLRCKLCLGCAQTARSHPVRVTRGEPTEDYAMTLREISIELGVSHGTVQNDLARALRKLRAAMVEPADLARLERDEH